MNSEHIIQSAVCMLAIDGRIDEQEVRFLQQLRQRLGLPAGALNQALQQAKAGKGRVSLPENPAEQQRVFEVLVHAALADGTITPEERRILDAVGERIGLRQDLIAQSIGFHAEEARKSEATRQAEETPISPPSIPRPVPQEPATHTCPKCGVEQDRDRLDCVRCGIVFSRFKAGTTAPDEAAPDEEFLYPIYDETGEAADKLEQFQSISVLLNHAGAVLLTLLVITAVGFGVAHMPELGGYRYLIVFGLILAAAAVMGRFAVLNAIGVVARGEVTNKWMFRNRRHYSRYGRHSRQESYHLEYVFQPGHDPSGELRRGKTAVSKSQASRYRIGAPVKVRYLPGAPWIHRLEIW